MATLPTLLENTDLSLVNEFVIYNDATPELDNSTSSYVRSVIAEAHEPILFRETNLRSPVAVMIHFMGRSKAQIYAKIDNDIIVPPGWLETMLGVMERNPEVELLGMEPGHGGKPRGEERLHGVEPAKHIGGVGLIRMAAFRSRPAPTPDGYFGFTEWQHTHETGSFWVAPDLRVCSLDTIPVEPWMSIRARYIKAHLNREWPLLDPADHWYWDWFTG